MPGGELSDWSLLGFARRRAPRWELLLYWGTIQTGGCKGIWIIGPSSGTRLWCEKCESGVDKGGQSGEFVSRRVTNFRTSTRSNSNFRLRWNINWWSSSCPLKSSLFQLLSPLCRWKSRVWRGCLIELICLSATYLSAQSRALRLTNRLTSSPGCPERPTMARQGPHLT